MKKTKKNDILKVCITLFLITAIISLCLAGLNMLTKDKIAAHEGEKEFDTVRSYYVYGTTFEKKLSDPLTSTEQFEYYEATYAEGGCAGYATTVSVNGYGGEIKMTVCFDTLGQVNGMGIIEWSETGGVGTRIEGEGFFEQFIGKVAPFKSVKGDPSAKNEISALSGATVSSRAATAAVNKAYTLLADFFIED